MSAATNNRSNWRISEFVAHAQNVTCASLSPSNARTLVTGGEDRRVNLWIIGQPRAITSISGLSSPVGSVIFNNTEDCVAAGAQSGTIKIFDLNENKVRRNISGHKAAVRSLDFHRYGDILASGSMDTNIKLWDSRRKGCIYTYKGHTEVINAIQFSPDGKWLVSASSDSTVKLWDLSAGKQLASFQSHSAAATSVQFHPKELLLASGGADRVVFYWELEDFQLVGSSPPESSAIRKVLFHSEGGSLFTGSQDSLRVQNWEPVTHVDFLPVPWGKVADIQESGEQLIGASFAQTNVSLWCIDIKKLKPWNKDAPSYVPPSLSASGRRQFQYREEVVPGRPPTHAMGPKPEHPDEVNRLVLQDDVGGDSPPAELRDEERREVFQSREQLVRTPPKPINLRPFEPPRDLPPSFPLLDDFVKDSKPALHQTPAVPSSFENIVQDIENMHADLCTVLRNRLEVMQEARAQWSLTDPKASLELAIDRGNQSAIVDVLSILNLRRSLWTLDMALLVLPEVRMILRSNHNRYVECACCTLKLLLRSFSAVISDNTNASSTPTNVVDLAREERVAKCQGCYSHLQAIRGDIAKLRSNKSPAYSLIKKLQLEEAFSLLQ